MEKNIPDGLAENAGFSDFELTFRDCGELFTPETLLTGLWNCLKTGMKEKLPFVGLVLFLSVLTRLMKSFSSGVGRELMETVSFLAVGSSLCLSAGETAKTLSTLTEDFSGQIVPIASLTLSIVSASGSPGLALSSGNLLRFLLGTGASVLLSFLPLFLSFQIAFASVAAFSGSESALRLSDSITAFLTGGLTLLGFVISGMAGIGRLGSSGSDSLVKNGLKYAAGSYIPVAGSYIGEGIDLYLNSVASVKNTAGIFGIAFVTLTFVLPILSSLTETAVLSGSAFLCGLCGNHSLERFLSTVKNGYWILFSSVTVYAVTLCVLFAVMTVSR